MPVAKINVICGESDTKYICKKGYNKVVFVLLYIILGICACTMPGVVNVHGAQGYGACAQLIVTGA